MEENIITGGCISIWRENPLDQNNKFLLTRYSKYLNFLTHSFTIKFGSLKKVTLPEKLQILFLIGFIPKEEITICGFSDVIFPSAEAILKDSGGFLSSGVGATKEEFSNLKGKVKKIHKIEFDSYYPYFEFRTYHLIDREFTANYFNRLDDSETREMYSLKRFRQLERDYPNAKYGDA